ncbi:vanadium-dependent haloperoxidase [Negadavirga shengliensis]|uniref:Vanadium-dependent haloperoxidase n=1 Tax=Negadavirga shengliensis TaxID=1389218 RepID=A0ABV9T401_9BACT
MEKPIKSFCIIWLSALIFVGISVPMDQLWAKAIDKTEEEKKEWFLDHLFSITEVMVTDVASPPGAARFYSYSLLAAYIIQSDLTGTLHQSPLLKNPGKPALFSSPDHIDKHQLDKDFCSIYGMLEVGKGIMPSGKNLAKSQEKLIRQFRKAKILGSREIDINVRYAQEMASQVLDYAKSDGYNQLSTLKRYMPSPKEGRWYPTPPAYMAAVEPEWRTIRTFFIDELKDFAPPAPAVFTMDEGSPFHDQVFEVYHVTENLSDEQKLIANFWDCNPFNVTYSGHMAIGIKKISPGGHWIGITGIASRKAGLSMEETIYIHTLVAMGLHDAFVSCWEEKYKSDRIRPITAINKHIDPAWQPLLQTPPFPEYTSGHSVISKTSAVILTDYFGENFDFIDTSEVYFGLPERAFGSFFQAADEAAISRLYGGIHFRDAIEVGVAQGEKIGQFILEKVKSESILLGKSKSDK